ncbi:MAG: ABC transporter substrate-binding protein, partial [Anaerovoracaceae bacterium]
MKKLCAILLICMLLLTGCGGQTAGTETETSGMAMAMDNETLVYGSGDYTAINPALYEHGEINALLFAGMTAHDAENNVVAGLAESWDFAEDTLTWTFRLREGLT